MTIKHINDINELRDKIVELIVLRDIAGKNLDSLRFQYEISIGGLALEAFRLSIEVEKVKQPIDKKLGLKNKEIDDMYSRYEIMLNEHNDIINNYISQALSKTEMDELNQTYSHLVLYLSPDVVYNYCDVDLDLWHQCEIMFQENDLHGLKQLKSELISKNIDDNFMIDLSNDDLLKYYKRLDDKAIMLRDEIKVNTDSKYHFFWDDLLNEEAIKDKLQTEVDHFKNIISKY